MDPKRWSDINRIFHAALDVEPGERRAFIASASSGDLELQAEVESLIKADEEAGSYLDQPLVSAEALASSSPLASPLSAPLSVGEVLCDRFRILREIAEGGMGHVFEAFDTELAVHVALKVIQPEIAANPEAIARFRQEVRLARTITHPNICRTFDIDREVRESREPGGRRTELVFLTMEFLPGETLAARLKRDGPLPLDQALNIARQVAAAMQAAHALGVIHRDLKPANIMLVESTDATHEGPRAVVTDFGLARLDPVLITGGLSSFTHTGHPIGTLAYMAPEQLEGAAVSPATDIYSFGLILFEMLTGQRAFAGDNLLSSIAQRLRGSVLFAQRLPANTPAGWRHALEASLATHPEDRPQSAAQLIEMLEGTRSRFLPSWKLSRRFTRKLLPRIAMTTTALLLVVALLATGLRFYQVKPDSPVTPGALVYLTHVDNQTGKQSFDILNELIQAGLSQSMQVNLLDQGRIGDILQQMTKSPDTTIDPATAREIAMRAGAARVIFATITGSNNTYSLNIDIQQPDNTPTRYRDHWTKSFTWHSVEPTSGSGSIPNELLTTIRMSSDWIRREAGESANDIARLDVPPDDVTTNSWQAMNEYLHSEQLIRADKPSDAVVALQRAVQIDPQFALAYGGLADIQMTLHHESGAFEAYKKALDPSLERRLSRRERDRIEGMYALDSGDFAAAVDAFRDYQPYYPNDALGWIYPEYPLVLLGRIDEDIANLKRALYLEPGDSVALNRLANAYSLKGDLASARNAIAQIKNATSPIESNDTLGYIAFLDGQYDQSQTLFLALKTSPDPRMRSRSFEMLADLAAERGDYASAERMLDDGIQEDISQGNPEARSSKLTSRAWVKAKLGDFVGCSSDLREAIKADPSPQLILSVESILGQAIQLASAASAPRLRQQMMEIEQHLPAGDYGMITRILKMRTHAEAKLAAGDVNAAVQQFRDLAAIDAPAVPREYLGRALRAAAASEPARSRELNLEAQQTYVGIVQRPAMIWTDPLSFPPGFLGDALSSYLHLSDFLGDTSAPVQTARQKLAGLRNSQP